MSATPTLPVSQCRGCHSRFLPRPGPCPRCGGTDLLATELSGVGTVLAAVELHNPAEGWSAPHRLALVEVSEEVRVLAIASEALPRIGSRVLVLVDGPRYRLSSGSGERGEGDLPAAGRSRPPFEPPR